mmetsp:Transcript_35553/g.81477  ORF Transcript_35553/g.81477 Transcript_35553/m.81477 type:complete len:322 (-) Transcript_35553:103-1068(-)
MKLQACFAAPVPLQVTPSHSRLVGFAGVTSRHALLRSDNHGAKKAPLRWLLAAAIYVGHGIQAALRPHQAANKAARGVEGAAKARKNSLSSVSASSAPPARLAAPDFRSKALLAAAANLKASPDTFSEMVLCYTLRDAAKLQLGNNTNTPIIDAVVYRIKMAPSKFTQKDLSNILWAALHLDDVENLADAVLFLATQRLAENPSDFTIEDMSSVLIFCATHNRCDPSLSRMILEEVEDRRAELTADDVQIGLAGILWAIRQFNEVPLNMLQSISELLTREAVRKLDSQARFHLLWSFKTLDETTKSRYLRTLNILSQEMPS